MHDSLPRMGGRIALACALVAALAPGAAQASALPAARTSPALGLVDARVVGGTLHVQATARQRSARVRVAYAYRDAGRTRTRRWSVRARLGRIRLDARLGRSIGATARRGRLTLALPGRPGTVRASLPFGAGAQRSSATAPGHAPGIAGGSPLASAGPAAGGGAPRAGGADLGLFEDVQYLTGSALDQRLDAYKASGAKWVRFQLIWANVQVGGPNYYYWAAYDQLIAGLAARGLKPLPILIDTPAWARASDCTDAPECHAADPQQFANFAAVAAARYKNQGVHDWEIWNEPNSRIFYKPNPDPAEYTTLLRATYTAIKSVDPSATVITGGTAPAANQSDAQGVKWIAPTDFLQGIYDNGGRGYFDAVGQHPYTFPNMPDWTSPWSAWYQTFGTTTSFRSIMAAHGDGAKKIWATEFGAHTDPQGVGYVTEAQQAAMVTVASRLWSSYSWAGPLIFYSYIDRGTDPADRENFFGLVRADGTPKPALAAFRAAATGG